MIAQMSIYNRHTKNEMTCIKTKIEFSLVKRKSISTVHEPCILHNRLNIVMAMGKKHPHHTWTGDKASRLVSNFKEPRVEHYLGCSLCS